jgi:spermidine synthase
VLVLGGGDGLAVREILKYPSVERVTVVDLDPEMTHLSSRFPLLARLNQGAFSNPRVQVVNADAFIWVEETSEPVYDTAIIDFPDPNTFALGKLYTTRFYRLLRSRLTANAAVAVQSTSPMFARNSYWCIIRTLEASGLVVKPYYTAVPSFGLWGFALARASDFEIPRHPPAGLKFLDDQTLAAMFTLSKDIEAVPVEVNRLDNQVLVRYYEGEWKRFE